MSGNLFFQGMMYLVTLVFGGWLIAHGTDGDSGSGNVCAVHWNFYQSDPDSGRADGNDAERLVRISVDFWHVVETEPEIVDAEDAKPLRKCERDSVSIKMFLFITAMMIHWYLIRCFLSDSRLENLLRWWDRPEAERRRSVHCFQDFTM